MRPVRPVILDDRRRFLQQLRTVEADAIEERCDFDQASEGVGLGKLFFDPGLGGVAHFESLLHGESGDGTERDDDDQENQEQGDDGRGILPAFEEPSASPIERVK